MPSAVTVSAAGDAHGSRTTSTTYDAQGCASAASAGCARAADKLGRLIGRSANVDVDGIGGTDSVLDQWMYDPVGAAGALASSQRTIAGVLERSEQHSYDLHGRLVQTDTIQATNLGNRSYTQRFAYDANYGRLKARSLPHTATQSAEVIWTRYSKYGHPTRDSDGRTGADYRQITQVDASGQPTSEVLGGHWLSTTARREATGSVSGVSHAFDNALQRGIDYRYDAQGCASAASAGCTRAADVYGNLTEQALDGGAVIESLQYDNLHRLTQTARSGAASGTVNYGYDAAGNFSYKSDFSTALTNAYAYSGGACGGGPNAVKSVQLKAGGTRSYCYDGAGNLTSDNTGMSLRYDASQRPTVLHRGTADSQFRYGADGDKARQWGSSGQRLYVAGLEDRPDSNETESYLGDYALIKTSASTRSVQYLLRDRLGSVIGVADAAGTVEWRGFDAFGAPRSGNWADKSPNILGPNAETAHGFTQHEHLDGLGLIHMNGRVYDYAMGRFLGVDPFIQFPGNSQSLNPYSYILNNPLAGTDPTGYLNVCDTFIVCSTRQVLDEEFNGPINITDGGKGNGKSSGQKSTDAQGTSGGDASELGGESGTGDSFLSSAADVGSRLFAPNIVELGERGVEGSLGDNAIGFTKATANAVIGLINLAEVSSPAAQLVALLGIRDPLLIPSFTIADRQLGGAALFDVAAVGGGSIAGFLVKSGLRVSEVGNVATLRITEGGVGTLKDFSIVATRTTRSGGQGVSLTRADGSVIDITAKRVKEFVPNKHPNAPPGALQRVKFPNAQPGTKGLKRDPTPDELRLIEEAFK